MEASIVAPNYNYIEFYGLTQEVFGAGVNVPSLPGDAAAFSDNIHLNNAGYPLYAQASFDTYRVHLVPETSSALALLFS